VFIRAHAKEFISRAGGLPDRRKIDFPSQRTRLPVNETAPMFNEAKAARHGFLPGLSEITMRTRQHRAHFQSIDSGREQRRHESSANYRQGPSAGVMTRRAGAAVQHIDEALLRGRQFGSRWSRRCSATWRCNLQRPACRDKYTGQGMQNVEMVCWVQNTQCNKTRRRP